MLKQLTGVEVMPQPSKWSMFLLIEYTFYSSAQLVSEDDWSALLPRKEFLKWFYALFFRIALPRNVDIFEPNTVIFSPLNLTILFLLMDQFRSRHHPFH